MILSKKATTTENTWFLAIIWSVDWSSSILSSSFPLKMEAEWEWSLFLLRRCKKRRPWKCLGEDVGYLLRGRHKPCNKVPYGYFLTNKIIVKFDMFGSCVEDKINRYMECTKIIMEKLRRISKMNPNIMQQECEPSVFNNGGYHTPIFCFKTKPSNCELLQSSKKYIFLPKDTKTSSTSAC